MARLGYNNGQTQTRRGSLLNANPVMRRLDKVQEYSETDAASYSGIFTKTALFMLFTLAGVIVYLAFKNSLAVGNTVPFTYKGFEVDMQTHELVALGVSLILGLVFQLLAVFVKGSTPVTGSLYCVTQGFFVAFLLFKVLEGKEYLGALALIITFLIILIMLFLYSKGIIRVTKKFKTVMLTLVITMVATSVLSFIGYLIPFTRELFMSIRSNFAISLISSIIFIIIAALFLISDFDTINHVVNDKLPKKYEWWAAFGLAFTVIWIYIKVLDIIILVLGRGNKK